MYIVIEMQTSASTAVLTTAYSDINIAQQAFYSTCSFAVVSSIPVHTVMLVSETGRVIKCECFSHRVEAPQPNPEEVLEQ